MNAAGGVNSYPVTNGSVSIKKMTILKKQGSKYNRNVFF